MRSGSWKHAAGSMLVCLAGALVCYYLGHNPVVFLLGFFLFVGGLLLLAMD